MRGAPPSKPVRTPWAAGSSWRIVAACTAVALAAVGAIAASGVGLSPLAGATAGAVAGLLGTLALPSFPTRRVVTVLLGAGGLAAVRHASFARSDTSWLLVLWAGATLVALVVADRAGAEEVEMLPRGAPLAGRAGEVARFSLALAVIVAVGAIALAPLITPRLGRHVWPGRDPGISDLENAPTSLRATDRLEMTQRPRLSDRVVFTVDAPRGEFWRGQTFDVWDGETWSRSDPSSRVLVRTGAAVQVTPDPNDVGANTGVAMRQTFHVDAGFSNVLFAAPSPVSVETDQPIRELPDATVSAFGGFGHGAVYSVTSRSALPTEALLRAADRGPLPARVRRQYAQPPVTSDRVRSLARRIASSAPTTYDKILAFEAWMGSHVRYSLHAPLSPEGVDVVDDFLFRSRLGWCEQIASSLVVMARADGIPARLATGFVPGARDSLTGQFVVRERDAHAWAEVYFPGVGWQPFDPTASVPLAGEAGVSRSWIGTARQHAWLLGSLAVVLLVVLLAFPQLAAWARRRLDRRHASWAARELLRLERFGRRAGRAREPAETPREYAAALASHLGDDRLRMVGDTLDAAAFSHAGASDAARSAADAVLTSLQP